MIEGFNASIAILVGINRYSGGVPMLQTPVADTRRLATLLECSHGFSTEVITDEQATFKNLKTLLAKLPNRITKNDRVLFYFAGHGIAVESSDGPKGYLLPQDAQGDSSDRYLPMTDLNAALSELTCRHMLVILDCCFAGALRWSSTRDIALAPQSLHRERYEWYVREAAWQAIASAAHDQRALDVASGKAIGDRGEAGRHSPFASALIAGLEGAADRRRADGTGDGVITATELYLHLDEALAPKTEGMERQTPLLWPLPKHDKGQFVFLVPGQQINLPPAPPLNPEANPWRGLKVYDSDYAHLFFGRRKASEQLAAMVVAKSLVVVTGPSGIGKSSLVRAGLVPRLSLSRQPIITRPGPMPFKALATALQEAGTRSSISENVLCTEPFALAEWVKLQRSDHILLVVDQIEELITMNRDGEVVRHYLSLIANALHAHDTLRVVFTVRAEFEPQFSQSPLRDLWLTGRYLVPQMTQDELRRVIEGPASVKVMRFESAELVDQLVNEVVQMPGALPLLSFALSEMYSTYLHQQASDRTLTREHYDALEGGVAGSLRVRANQIIDSMADSHKVTVRRVLERLVSVNSGEFARRRVPRRELESADAAELARIDEVIRRLDDARLIVTDVEKEPYLELAHDALILGWDRLLGWVREDLERIIVLRRLTPDADEWSVSRNAGLLWDDDARSVLVRQLQTAPFPALNGREQKFAAASLRRGKRNKVVLWSTVAALVLLLAAALVAANFARIQSQAALRQLDVAVKEASDRLLEVGVTKITDDPALSVRMAEAAGKLNPNIAPSELRDLLVNAVYANPVWARLPPGQGGEDGSTLFPPVFTQSQQPFATDLNISYVLTKHPTAEGVLALYEVDTGRIVATLNLESGSMIDDDLYARKVIAVRKPHSERSRLELFELNPRGLSGPSVSVDDGRLFTCANGDWPCAIAKSDGSILIYSRLSTGDIKPRKLGVWQGVTRLILHPTGQSLVLITQSGQAIWLGNIDINSPNGPTQKNLGLTVRRWYSYEEEFPWIVWGPSPNQLAALELSAPDGQEMQQGGDAKAVLSAIDALTGKKQILREGRWKDSGIGRQAIASDLLGSRLVWVRTIDERGMVPEVLTLHWPTNSEKLAGRVVEEVQGRGTGFLYGELPATAIANIQTLAMSPNGNFAVVANDIRGTSGTQTGRGTLESWNLTLLPDNTPDRSALPISSQAHAVKIAYAADSSRVAVLDALGTTSVFRLRHTEPPGLTVGLRMPEQLYDRFAPHIRAVGTNRRYLLVRYAADDHRWYDLATGQETPLEAKFSGETVLSVKFDNNELIVATTNRLVSLAAEGEILRTKVLPSTAEKATIGEEIISVLIADNVSFFDRISFSLIGSAKATPASLPIAILPQDELHAYERGNVPQLPSFRSQNKTIRAYFVQDWTLEAWEGELQSNSGSLQFRRIWSKSLPDIATANRWYSLRRVHNPDVIMILIGANHPDVKPVLWQLDAETGVDVARYMLPEIALVPDRKLFEIFDVLSLDNERIAIVFRFYPTAVGMGVWDRAGGSVLSWYDYGHDSDLHDVRVDVSGKVLLTLRGYAKEDNYRYALVDLASGRELWSGEFDPLLPVPYLKYHKGKWQIHDDGLWQNTARTLLTGGGNFADAITTIHLPEEEALRIEQLAPHGP